jgi:hypothetical protein
MKLILKIIIILIIIYVVLVAIFWISGLCPNYLNSMPQPVGANSPALRNDSLQLFLKVVKLCPFTQKVY